MDPTVAACQVPVDDLDVAANLDRVADRLSGLPDEVDAALFPELGLTGFVADDRLRAAAISIDGPELDRLRDLAAAHDASLVVGFAEQRDDRYHNTTAYVTPGGAVTPYRKRHLWGGEPDVFTPGDDQVVVETPAGTTGLVTCYDLNFVRDSVAFLDAGVDALFVVGAWPATHAPNWRLLVRARALDGVRWAVACARTGRKEVPGSPTVEYAGRSVVVRPDGVVGSALAHAPGDLVATLDQDVLAAQRDLVDVPVGPD
jgi:predicted amidohydrolase